jgi:hypothetical protein
VKAPAGFHRAFDVRLVEPVALVHPSSVRSVTDMATTCTAALTRVADHVMLRTTMADHPTGVKGACALG